MNLTFEELTKLLLDYINTGSWDMALRVNKLIETLLIEKRKGVNC
jgi:hypothetical protein